MEDTKDVNIEEEQKKIVQKLSNIRDSKIENNIKQTLENVSSVHLKGKMRVVDIMGRVKKDDSATEKLAKQNVTADRIYDLIGFMIIVDTPESYIDAISILDEQMPNGHRHQFEGKNDNGYESYHMGIDVGKLLNRDTIGALDLNGLQSEVQLKSYGMYLAQESTHDSIYKNPKLSQEEKDNMQSVMFPLIQKITDIESYEIKLQRCRNAEEREFVLKRIEETKSEILNIKESNINFTEQYASSVNEVWAEYCTVKYMQELKANQSLSLLNEEEREALQNNTRLVVSKLMSEPQVSIPSRNQITGISHVDYALSRVLGSSIEDISKMSEEIRQANFGITELDKVYEEKSTAQGRKAIVNNVKEDLKTKEEPEVSKDDQHQH